MAYYLGALIIPGLSSTNRTLVDANILGYARLQEQGEKHKNLILTKFEEAINRKINLLFEPKISNLSKELKNNLANGIVLSGYLVLE